MKGLDEIVEENKKADVDKTKVKIELNEQITVEKGCTDSVLVITKGKDSMKFTTTVLRMMLARNKNKEKADFWINRKILRFLQNL